MLAQPMCSPSCARKLRFGPASCHLLHDSGIAAAVCCSCHTAVTPMTRCSKQCDSPGENGPPELSRWSVQQHWQWPPPAAGPPSVQGCKLRGPAGLPIESLHLLPPAVHQHTGSALPGVSDLCYGGRLSETAEVEQKSAEGC